MRKTKILVVEDEVIVAKDIQRTLIKLGYDVPVTAQSAQSAFEKIDQVDPDLIFCDIKLKGEIDGIDIAKVKPGASVEYFNEVVVDRLSDLVLDQAKINCGSSYNYLDFDISSKAKDSSGFYACVSPDQKSVKLWIHKQPNLSAKSTMINALVVTRSN